MNLKSIIETFEAVREYVFPHQKIKNKFNTIKNFNDLENFIKDRSAFVTQTTLYGYLKTRMGLKYTMMFNDEVFLESIDKSKWNIFGEAVSDLTLYTLSILINKKKIEKADAESLFQSIINRETSNGMPKDIAENLKMNFHEKMKTTNLNSYCNETPFISSGLALYKWAPIADELKELDKEIVLNSIKNKWNIVISDFEKLSLNFNNN
ncbi:MAG: esterase [Candidatus Pelagibacter sp. TMED165]|nr:MAG: esterase [Candidatus Pelagibacter sp. TMED165]